MDTANSHSTLSDISDSNSSPNTSPVQNKEPLTKRLIPKWRISKLSSILVPQIYTCLNNSKSAPKPLPKLRPRALTNPLPPPPRKICNVERSGNTSFHQQESLFFTMLPVEIRLRIYSLIVVPTDHRLVHILVKQNRLGHFRCRFPYDSSPSEHTICDPEGKRCLEGWLSYKASHLGGKGQDQRYILRTDDNGEVALLCTCKAVYAEVVRELYRLNCFHFSDVRDLRAFTRGVIDSRMKDVREMVLDWDRDGLLGEEGRTGVESGKRVKERLKRERQRGEEWREAWKIIGQMEGLQSLRVVLKSNSDSERARQQKREMGVLMMDLKGLRRFELVVPWDNEDGWENMENAPFEVMRGAEPAES